MSSRADHSGRGGQPGPDGQVAVAGEQRRDERQQRGEIGGRVHVHVGQDRRVAGGPHGLSSIYTVVERLVNSSGAPRVPGEEGLGLCSVGPDLLREPSLPAPGVPAVGRQAPGSRPAFLSGTGGAGRGTREVRAASILSRGGGLGWEGGRDAPGRRGSARRHSVVRGLGTRKSSLRRTGPQTKHVDVTGAQGSPMGKLRTGIVPAPAVPRRDADVFTPLPSGRPRKKGIHQAVISPHRNPPSSRATAAATTLFTLPPELRGWVS